jgi:hypothetical protein
MPRQQLQQPPQQQKLVLLSKVNSSLKMSMAMN